MQLVFILAKKPHIRQYYLLQRTTTAGSILQGNILRRRRRLLVFIYTSPWQSLDTATSRNLAFYLQDFCSTLSLSRTEDRGSLVRRWCRPHKYYISSDAALV